ncbi:MAG: dihydroneopterin aldolase [Myxococcales bacterium]|nr:dihydroneopterin aldolase [Myxococcales bacterium]
MFDRISIEGLEIGVPVGVYEAEKGIFQRVVIDVSVRCDVREAAASDALEFSLDYDQVASTCRVVATSQHHQLIETIAEKIAARLHELLGERIREVWVKVAKPGAVPDARSVSVEICRSSSHLENL